MPGTEASSGNSSSLRKRGNKYYFEACEAPADGRRKSLLELAQGLYQKALDAAIYPEDCASAHKNLAVTLTQLARCNAENEAGSSSNSAHQTSCLTTAGLLCQAAQHRCSAYLCGVDVSKNEEWMNEAWDGIGTVMDQFSEVLSSLVAACPGQIVAALHQLDLLRSVVPEELQGWHVHAASSFLHSVKDTAAALIAPTPKGLFMGPQEPDWRTCLNVLAETKRALIETLVVAIDCQEDGAAEELLQLEDDLWQMSCCCESTQARLQGDQLLERVIPAPNSSGTTKGTAAATAGRKRPNEDEQLEGVLLAIDFYKSAAVLARERDLQAEAQAFSRLGHVYKVYGPLLDRVCRPSGQDELVTRSAEERSREAFLRVLGLVDALPHRIMLMMEDWYREARDAISEYQRTTAAEETARREKERAPIREELKEELSALYAAAGKGWVELLKHCYTKHPPLNPANRVTDFSNMSAENGKELLRKAIVAYHPDKQSGPESTKQWQVLAEEITKALTQKYECFK